MLLLRLLFLLMGLRGDILEGDCAFDLLAGEDGLVAPMDEDANVGLGVGRHDDVGGRGRREEETVARGGDGQASSNVFISGPRRAQRRAGGGGGRATDAGRARGEWTEVREELRPTS